MEKKTRRNFLRGAGAVLAGTAIAGCSGSSTSSSTDSQSTETANNVFNGIRIEWGQWTSDSFSSSLGGFATNVTDSTFEYVGIEGNFYDPSGNILSSGFDNITGLGAGQTWEFSVMFIGNQEQLDGFQLTEVTAY